MSKSTNLIGKKYNKLLVVKKSDKRDKNRNIYWYCQCDCGNKKLSEVSTDSLVNNRIKSCGCSRKKLLNLIGNNFERWEVIDFGKYDNKNYYWICQCSCQSQTTRPVEQSRLLNGRSKSCGCLARELSSERKKRDITGNKYNKLTALRHINKGEKGLSIWECLCECGEKKMVVQGDLTSGSVKSCGCLKTVEDITGKKYGWLTVIGRSSKTHPLYTLWECDCKCGNRCHIPYSHLKSGSRISCGCYRYRVYDEITIGLKVGRLKVLERSHTLDGSGTYYKCQCECGNKPEILGTSLRSGHTNSCGCLQKEKASETHYKGTTTISEYCRSLLKVWKEKSKKASKYRCVITGERFSEIHHLYPFSKIIDEIIENAQLTIKEDMKEYTIEQIKDINYWNYHLHRKYGLGVCLNEEMHRKFHSKFRYDFEVEDFHDFYKQYTGKDFDLVLNWE